MAPKKSAKKSSVAKRTVARGRTKAKAPAKKLSLSVNKPYTKSQIITYLSDSTDVKKRDVSALMDSLQQLMEVHLNKKGPGEFNMPGLYKCRVIHKPATKARKGINPFTGEPTTFKARPARSVVKIRPLKKLKEMV